MKEQKQWEENRVIPNKRPELKVGDEITVNIRGRIVEIGSELITINLVELTQQGRVNQDVLVYCPPESINSSPIRERLPNEIPI